MTDCDRAMIVVEVCVASQEDDGECFFCNFEGSRDEGGAFDGTPHDPDCPLVEESFIDRQGGRV